MAEPYTSRATTVRRFEDAPLEPESSYGILKLMFEHYLRMSARHGWLTSTILRVGNPYGVLLPLERRQGLIGDAMRRLINGGPRFRVFGGALHACATMCISTTSAARSSWGTGAAALRVSVYNIGSGRGHSVQEVLDALSEVTRRDIRIERDETVGVSRIMRAYRTASSSMSRRQNANFDWQAMVELRDGLARMWRVSTGL